MCWEGKTPRVRELGVDLGMAQPLDAVAHDVRRIEEERHLVQGVGLLGPRRRPVVAVLDEERHPLLEAALVEQARLVDQEPLDR